MTIAGQAREHPANLSGRRLPHGGAVPDMWEHSRMSDPRNRPFAGSAEQEFLFQTIPGIGPTLAAKIRDLLSIDSLEALEIAAHDGRLAAVPGVGARRAASVAATLATRLARHRPLPAAPPKNQPAVEQLGPGVISRQLESR